MSQRLYIFSPNNDEEKEALASEGFGDGSINDAQFDYLGSLGFTGALPDRTLLLSSGPSISLSSSSVPEGSAQGTDIATVSITNASNPGAISIASQEVANLFQMNVDGVTLEVGSGAAGLDYETRTSATVTLEFTDDNDTYQFLRTISITQVAPSIVTPLADVADSVGNGPFTVDYSGKYSGSLRTVSLFEIPEDSGITIDTGLETITIPDSQILGSVFVAISNAAGTVYDDFNVDVSVANGAPEVVLNAISLTVPGGTAGIPVISSSSPADNATDVAIDVDPTVTFDTNIAFGSSGSIYIYDVTGTTILETFDVATEQGTSPGQVSISGAVLTIHPTSDLSNSNEYAIQWTAGAVESSVGGYPVAALSDTTTISFTTEAAAGGIQFVGRYAEKNQSTSFTLSLTSLTGGIGTAPIEGDLVVVHYGIGTLANRNPAVTGYTSIASLHIDDVQDTNLRAAYKVMTATPDTSVDVTATNSSGSKAIVLIEVWRGVDTTTPMDVTPVTASGLNTVLANPNSITPVTAGAKVVACAVGSHLEGAQNFASSDLSNVYTDSNDGTNDVSLLCGSVDWTSGAVDPAQLTFGGSDSTNYSWASVTYALRPA